MSAIVGIFYRDDKPVEKTLLQKMMASLSHRGPDGESSWVDRNVALGHLMLQTTAESRRERLPLANASGELVITADARIDNREELRDQLGLTNDGSEGMIDSRLILAAYEKWGEDCVERLLGDFVFAIWDKRSRSLFCARDHFGVKPFYYYAAANLFAFATEIKALLCIPGVSRRINEIRIAEHLTMSTNDSSITFFQEISRLKPAHALRVDRTGERLANYWALDPGKHTKLSSDEEYAEEFRRLFTEAVRCRTRSAYPLGAMLSGGLDSSSIACLAREVVPPTDCLHTFSAVHDVVTQCDERDYQNVVLARGGFQPHTFQTDHASPLLDVDAMMWHLDEVQGSGNIYANWSLYGSARDAGVRVLLDGFDGDSTVSHGRGYLDELARAGRWIKLASEVRHFTKKRGQSWTDAYGAWVRSYGIDPIISRHKSLRRVRRAWRSAWSRLRPNANSAGKAVRNDTLRADYLARIGWDRAARPRPSPKTERQVHYSLLTNPGMTGALESLNHLSAAFGTEVRFPFWDKRLIEYCLSLPTDQKWHKGWTRIVLRRAMKGILPESIQWRQSKTDVSPAFYHGLLTYERELANEIINVNPGIIEDYVQIPALREAYARFVTHTAHDSDVVSIWKTVSLALWLQQLNRENLRLAKMKGGERNVYKEELLNAAAPHSW